MTLEQKAIATVTRCGPFSALAARNYVKHLLPAEIETLAELHDEHEHYATQGDRFTAVINAAADRPQAMEREVTEVTES